MDLKEGNNNKDSSEATQKRELRLFVLVMVIFTIGMVFLLIFEVSQWWIWYLYLAIWTLIEYRIAKNIKLKWWWWAIIITAILVLDSVVIELVDYFKM